MLATGQSSGRRFGREIGGKVLKTWMTLVRGHTPKYGKTPTGATFVIDSHMDKLCQQGHDAAADEASQNDLDFREFHARNSVLNRS